MAAYFLVESSRVMEEQPLDTEKIRGISNNPRFPFDESESTIVAVWFTCHYLINQFGIVDIFRSVRIHD